MVRPIRRLAAALACAFAFAGVPFSVVTVSVPAPSRADVCEDGQPDCSDSSCDGSDGCQAPPPAIVPVPVPRPNVNACVNLGGRRRVSVSGCI